MLIENGLEVGPALADYMAQITSCVYERCQGKTPFDYIMLFFRENVLAFPTTKMNSPHNLPIPSDETLKRGAHITELRLFKPVQGYSSLFKAIQGKK
jgi:hypothetical protein